MPSYAGSTEEKVSLSNVLPGKLATTIRTVSRITSALTLRKSGMTISKKVLAGSVPLKAAPSQHSVWVQAHGVLKTQKVRLNTSNSSALTNKKAKATTLEHLTGAK